MFDLVVIGHLLKEYIHFSDGREIGPVLGSPCAYASVAGARLGLKVGIVTKVGKDMPSELLGVFTEAGVDIRGIRTGRDTTSNLLIYDESGRKRLEFLKKAPNILFEDIPQDYLDTSLFLICPIDYEVQLDLIKSLYQSDKRLSMELGGYGGASSGEKGKIPKSQRLEFLKEMIPYFDIVKGSREDYQCMFEKDLVNEKEISIKFIEWGAKISIITLGEEGAIMATQNRTSSSLSNSKSCALSYEAQQFSAYPSKVTDCTGAGDVFHAGFLAEYIRTRDLKKSTQFALATASLVIENTGGVTVSRMPTQEKVLEKIRMEAKGKCKKKLELV